MRKLKNLFFATIAVPLALTAGECKTKNGTTCTATCKVGTLSQSCGENSCSSSCSDASGNRTAYAADLYRDIVVATDGRVDRRALKDFFARQEYRGLQSGWERTLGGARLTILFNHNALDLATAGTDIERVMQDLERIPLDQFKAPGFRYTPSR